MGNKIVLITGNIPENQKGQLMYLMHKLSCFAIRFTGRAVPYQ